MGKLFNEIIRVASIRGDQTFGKREGRGGGNYALIFTLREN